MHPFCDSNLLPFFVCAVLFSLIRSVLHLLLSLHREQVKQKDPTIAGHQTKRPTTDGY